MTQDEIIEMAREARLPNSDLYHENLKTFANLVAKHTLMNIDPSKFMSHQEVMEAARLAERQRIVNLLMIQHEGAKDSHNYWHVAANKIKEQA